MAFRFYLKGQCQFSTKQLKAFHVSIRIFVCCLLTLSVDKTVGIRVQNMSDIMIAREDTSIRRNLVAVQFCAPQISYELAWNITRTSALKGR
jgi:hypothetical protein